MEYAYTSFPRGLWAEEVSFWGGPRPGEPMPEFRLTGIDCRRVRRADFVGKRPLLLICGSIT